MTHSEGVVSKSAFARILGVSAAQVTHYINNGKIPESAMVGEGRGAHIDVAKAKEALAVQQNPAAVMGQGRLPIGSSGEDRTDDDPAPANQYVTDRNAIDLELRRLKLSEAQREAGLQSGAIIKTDDHVRQIGRITTDFLTVLDSSAAPLAKVISDEFNIPLNEVAILIRAEHTRLRKQLIQTYANQNAQAEAAE